MPDLGHADAARVPKALRHHAARNPVTDFPLANGRLWGLRVATVPMFRIAGSFETRARGCEDVLLQELVVAMLVCGSRRHDAFELADLLERRGAQLSFESDLRRVSWSASASVGDAPQVVALLGECLSQPRFEEAHLATEKARLIAAWQIDEASPAVVAGDVLARTLYPPGHLRYRASLDERIAQLERFHVEDVRRYYQDRLRASDLRIVVVGDIDPAQASALLREHLPWEPASAAEPGAPSPGIGSPGTVHQRLPNSEYFGVALGQRLSIRCTHPDYVPLWLGVRLLGGSFISRLMGSVREARGLTYAIRAGLSRPVPDGEGDWQVELSLSPANLEAGLAVTRAEIGRFVESGVTQDQMAVAKTEAIGSFQVGMAALGGLADSLLSGMEQEGRVDWLDAFPARIAEVDVVQLNRVIERYMRPDAMCEAIVGPLS